MRIYDSYGNLIYSDIFGELNLGKYTRNITIDNSSNSNSLTDYQILVTLDTASLISAGEMRSDCGDIRFYDFYDGTNNLGYWIESGINTTSTRIWVKVPSIPANGIKTIRMYYGNPTLMSTSNGDNTFLFFDDFFGSALDWTNKWQSTYQSYYTVSNGILNIALLTDTTRLLQTKNSFSDFEARVVMLETARQLYFDFSTTVGQYGGKDYIIEGDSKNTELSFYINNSKQGTATISTFTWYYCRAIIHGTAVQFIAYTDSGWSNVLLDKSATSSLSGARYPSFFVFVAGDGCQVDFIYIKKHSSPEPTTSVGNEYATPIRIR